jgi:hypothetical protein
MSTLPNVYPSPENGGELTPTDWNKLIAILTDFIPLGYITSIASGEPFVVTAGALSLTQTALSLTHTQISDWDTATADFIDSLTGFLTDASVLTLANMPTDGTADYVLTANGAGNAPTWQPVGEAGVINALTVTTGNALTVDAGATATFNNVPQFNFKPAFNAGVTFPDYAASGNYLYLMCNLAPATPFDPCLFATQAFINVKDIMTFGFYGTASPINVAFGATYTPCVASDIGKMVYSGASLIGALAWYDNTLKHWKIANTGIAITNATALTITGGTGAGTTNAASTSTGGGCIMIGHGLNAATTPPLIVLTDAGYNTLNLLDISSNPAYLYLAASKYAGATDQIQISPSGVNTTYMGTKTALAFYVTDHTTADTQLLGLNFSGLMSLTGGLTTGGYIHINPASGNSYFDIDVNSVNKMSVGWDGTNNYVVAQAGKLYLMSIASTVETTNNVLDDGAGYMKPGVGFKSSDGSAGLNATFSSFSSLTFKDGLLTAKT